MVSGWDKNPRPDGYEPDIGWSGRLILLAIVAIFLLAGLGWMIPKAWSAEAVTYACVEERSVGWEQRDNGPDAVGQFQPSAAPFILRYFPGNITAGKVTALARIEVTEGGETSTFTESSCLPAIRWMLDQPGQDPLQLCANVSSRPDSSVRFGFDDHRWYLTKNPISKTATVQYSESLVVGIAWAYANKGSCTLVQ